MKVYKAEVLVMDFEGLGPEGIKHELDRGRHSVNHIMSIASADIGEWDDDHPLNQFATMKSEYERLFPPNAQYMDLLQKYIAESSKALDLKMELKAQSLLKKKHEELQESWMKFFGTLTDIAVAAGMDPTTLAGIAENMACEMGDGKEILEFLRKKNNP